MKTETQAEIVRRAERLLDAGTLVFTPGERVAYAFVVPIEARDDLAEAFADLMLLADDGVENAQ